MAFGQAAQFLLAWVSVFTAAAIALLFVYCCLTVPRTWLHKGIFVLSAALSLPVIMLAGHWVESMLVFACWGLACWLLLTFAEQRLWRGDVFIHRRTDELRRNLVLLFVGDMLLVAVLMGVFHLAYAALAAVLAWTLTLATHA
ncbi:MAG: hypothetical protein QM302_07705 [Acidobacteriota bacterium]|nr:hypothetical protein [Acidobacteriota bacterium]